MTDMALIALLDTLLPGDDVLPAFSCAEIDPARFEMSAAPLLAAIDPAAFARATVADRVALLRGVQQDAPDAFQLLLGQVLAAYYQAPRVQAIVPTSFSLRSLLVRTAVGKISSCFPPTPSRSSWPGCSRATPTPRPN